MARILGVGNAIRDIICEVATYPEEDSETRVSSREVRLGGNVANTLTVLSQLGHHCGFAGITTSDADGQWLIEQLVERNIDPLSSIQFSKGAIPTSYILLNKENGSRTISHYRDLPELSHQSFIQQDLNRWDWIHFEGRNCTETLKMLTHVKQQAPHIHCSLEIEKHREGIESLFKYADVLIFSKEFIKQQALSNAKDFLTRLHQKFPEKDLICANGSEGAFGINQQGKLHEVSAFKPEKVIDTLAAGDVFNAGLLHQLAEQTSLKQAIQKACELAGKKCGQMGLFNLSF